MQTRVAEEQLDRGPVAHTEVAYADGRFPLEGVNLWPVAAKSTDDEEEDEEPPEDDDEDDEMAYDPGEEYDSLSDIAIPESDPSRG